MDETLRLDADRLAWREIGAETVVLDLRGSVYFGLNPTAARLWTLLASGATHGELSARLVAEQGIDVERASADVDAFLAHLRREGLLAAPSTA